MCTIFLPPSLNHSWKVCVRVRPAQHSYSSIYSDAVNAGLHIILCDCPPLFLAYSSIINKCPDNMRGNMMMINEVEARE